MPQFAPLDFFFVWFPKPPFIAETIGLGLEECLWQSSFKATSDINKPLKQTFSNFRDSYFSTFSWWIIFFLCWSCFQTVWIRLFLFYWSVSHFTQLTFTCSKSTIETLEKVNKNNRLRSGIFIVNFDYISPIFLLFLFLTLNT